MTVYVPSDASLVLVGTPVIGSVDEVNAAGTFVKDVGNDASLYLESVQGAHGALSGVTSEGVTRIRGKLGECLAPGASDLVQSAATAKLAFDSYAAEVDRIHGDARSTISEMSGVLALIRLHSTTIVEIAHSILADAPSHWRDEVPVLMPEPRLDRGDNHLDAGERDLAVQNLHAVYSHQWTVAASAWRQRLEDADTLRNQWDQLILDRENAEKRLVSALGDTEVGQLISVSADSGNDRRFTIATAISGELWGASEAAPALAKSHPLLEKLLGTESGEHVWDAPPDPVEAGAAWNALSEDERQRLIAEAPWVIGNLPGLPYTVRDEANRNVVDHYRRYPWELTPEQLKLMADLRDVLEREQSQIGEYGQGRPPIQVVALELTGTVPRVAVSYGDLDTASHTTWEVPGMKSDAHLAFEGWDAASRNLYEAQRGIDSFTGTSAVVSWLGYDTPGLFTVLDSNAAHEGAARLALELDGSHAARRTGGHGVPFTNVLAHSYGTTVATIALTLVKNPVDTLTMLGSAGLDTRVVPSLDALRVREVSPGQQAIYTTHAHGDRLAPFGAGLSRRGNPNPDARDFAGAHIGSLIYGGALSFSSEGSGDLLPTDGHSTIGEGRRDVFGFGASEGHGYLDRDTQSLDSVAQITMGQIDGRLLRSFIVTEAERPFIDRWAGTPLRERGEW